MFLLILAFYCQLLPCSCQNPKNAIARFKKTPAGQHFLKYHSEKSLEIADSFLIDPVLKFSELKSISGACEYFSALQDFFDKERGYSENDFYHLISNLSTSADQVRCEILTFLLLSFNGSSCNSTEKAAIVATYADSFSSSPQLFISALRTTQDWKAIVDSLGSEWSTFKNGVAKLGNSKFEKEFIDYVSGAEAVFRFWTDPEDPDNDISEIPDLCDHLRYWDMEVFFSQRFGEKSVQKEKIMTYMIWRCGQRPRIGDALARCYERQFALDPPGLVNELSKYRDWSSLVDLMLRINHNVFRAGISSIGNTEFGKQLKAFIDAHKKR